MEPRVEDRGAFRLSLGAGASLQESLVPANVQGAEEPLEDKEPAMMWPPTMTVSAPVSERGGSFHLLRGPANMES